MNKIVLIPIISLGIFLIFAFSLQLSNALQNTTTTTTNLTTDFTKFFTDNKDFQSCYVPSSCSDTIHVLYQDNSTIALESSYIDTIWKAVSAVKKDGYKIDGFNTFAETNILGKDQTIKTLVVMSK